MTGARAIDEPMVTSGARLARVASIYANSFVLDLLRIARGQRDVLDGVILLCLAEANWARLPPSASAAVASTAEAMVFRPSSIGALANSLGMPFETVRRRAAHLCEEGLCEHTPGGILIAEASAHSPMRSEALQAVAERLRELYQSLRRCGALTELSGANAASPPAAAAVQKVLFHLASAYFLRMLEQLRPNVRSILDGAVILAVYEINTSPLAAELLEGDDEATLTWPGPDRLRHPARVSEVAARLGLPHETIRRHAKLLVQGRALVAQRRGLVVPRTALLHPASQQAMTYSYGTLVRTFENCARLGVLAQWDAAEAPSPNV